MIKGVERFTFFWQTESIYSQWHPRGFRLDGLYFQTAEHWMMWNKGILFGDHAIAGEILAAPDPRAAKALGRKVKNFDANVWNIAARPIVLRGNLAKFSQHVDLAEQLMMTVGTTLVEASPYDKIWGIGLKADDPRAQSRDTWLGLNWLGEVITEVRDFGLMAYSVIGGIYARSGERAELARHMAANTPADSDEPLFPAAPGRQP